MHIQKILGTIASTTTIAVGAFLYGTATVTAIADISVFEKKYNSSLVNQINEDELVCLAKNIYFEARSESNLGQRAVAWVTLNRVFSERYPNTICGVVWQEKQFSWTHDGKSDIPKDDTAWIKAKSLAILVLSRYQNSIDPTDGATMFHAAYATPYWSSHYEEVVSIDNHIFYK